MKANEFQKEIIDELISTLKMIRDCNDIHSMSVPNLIESSIKDIDLIPYYEIKLTSHVQGIIDVIQELE